MNVQQFATTFMNVALKLYAVQEIINKFKGNEHIMLTDCYAMMDNLAEAYISIDELIESEYVDSPDKLNTCIEMQTEVRELMEFYKNIFSAFIED